MAVINTITFNDGSTGTAALYAQGDPIQVTVDYTPDTASVTAEPFTLTATITNAGGTVTATSSPADFTVNVPSAAGDVAAVTDSGSRTWTAGAVTADGSGGEDAVFTSVA
jgi:hypothetical protein